jgi:hypothetical protein
MIIQEDYLHPCLEIDVEQMLVQTTEVQEKREYRI